MFLLVGAVIANFIGTTGASMLLIRPLLQTNRERKHIAHIPIFFILLVSNVGGSLTPLGDPPLFMGYLKGVPFFWTLRLFPIWLLMVCSIAVIFYVFDRKAYAQETKASLAEDKSRIEPLSIVGKRNFFWLGLVLASVFFPFPYREAGFLTAVILSLVTTPKAAHKANEFTFNPIVEVAVLFAGIFVVMVPALLILKEHGSSLGITKPWQFFWLTGLLSSFLDNAPTYLTFFSLGQGLNLPGEGVLGIPHLFLEAVSVGAVFMGANSYIGNGPNFMVKAIAEEYKIKMPSFFGYMGYSFAVMIPLYIIVTLIFFK
jgi:Na+/H+ antiporter NhaD/arsenite permease-like protein